MNGPEQPTTQLMASEQVKLTTTSDRCQPAGFGSRETVAEINGGVPSTSTLSVTGLILEKLLEVVGMKRELLFQLGLMQELTV